MWRRQPRQLPGRQVMTAEVERLRALGARGVIAKPFDAMALPRQLGELLAWPGAPGQG